MTKKQYEELNNWVYEEIHHNRDYYSRSNIIATIMDKVEELVNKTNDIHDVSQQSELLEAYDEFAETEHDWFIGTEKETKDKFLASNCG